MHGGEGEDEIREQISALYHAGFSKASMVKSTRDAVTSAFRQLLTGSMRGESSETESTELRMRHEATFVICRTAQMSLFRQLLMGGVLGKSGKRNRQSEGRCTTGTFAQKAIVPKMQKCRRFGSC